ncbi:MAG: hypothetical protein IPG91_09335 [Ideonella sp.]|nr:hypothetical protein [Ideonella sp.]
MRTDEGLGTLAHLLRRLVGEGNGRDLPRRVARLEQARDLVHDHARLARAGAGEDEAGAAEVVHGGELGGVEGVGHGRRMIAKGAAPACAKAHWRP